MGQASPKAHGSLTALTGPGVGLPANISMVELHLGSAAASGGYIAAPKDAASVLIICTFL